jgi:aspartate dehydrogenase
MKLKRIGIIGCGAIGTQIAEYIQAELKNRARIAAICDVDSKKAISLSKKIKHRPFITKIDELIKKVDLIIESASANISGHIAEKAVLLKKDVLIMSTGGLLDKANLIENYRNIHIPSGAICGLDGLKSAMVGRIKSLTLTTRKPLKGLAGSPYLKKRGINLDKIKKETLLFSGNARQAIRYFPQNINVAVTLSIYGIGPDRTKVRIFTSPEYKRNIHEVEVVGEFGRLVTRTENVPSRANPKTSQLAIFSAIAKLKEIL